MFMRLVGASAFGIIAVCDFCLPGAQAATVAPAAAEAAATEAQQAESKNVTLRIDGMTCGGCAISARTVLRRLDGVQKAEVSYKNKLAIVTYDERKITPDRMIEALQDKLGYTAKLIEEPGS